MTIPSIISKTHIEGLRKLMAAAGDTDIAKNTSDQNIFGLWYAINFPSNPNTSFYRALLDHFPYLKNQELNDLSSKTPIIKVRAQMYFSQMLQKEIVVMCN